MVVGVTGDVKPGAWIDKRGIPALEDIGGVGELGPHGVKSCTCNRGGEDHMTKNYHWNHDLVECD